MKRFVSLLLAFFLLLWGCSKPPQTEPAAHTQLRFSELPDETPNVSLEIERVRELLFRIERGELSGSAAQEKLERRETAYRDIRSATALAYVRYCFDISNATRKAAYDLLKVQAETLYALLVKAHLLLAEDPALSDAYDAQTVAQLRRANALYDPDLEPLRSEERTLIGAYEAAREGFTIEAQGRRWTREQILSDPSLTYDSFKPLYEAFLIAYNREAGTIFLKLVAVRNRIARACGYPSYAEYAYDLYGRDYTTEEAARLSQQLCERFTPLLLRMQDRVFDAQMRLMCGTFSEAPTMRRVQETLVSLLPELSEPWTYMTAHGMYDVSASGSRMPGSFTTYLASYGAPFLYSAWDDSYTMVSTLVHEFGHYASYYENGDASDSLDFAEFDSQGLEILALSAYDKLYGALADAAKVMNLFTALYVVLDGCMEDAFQQYAYHTADVTLEQLNAEYGRLCDAYGMSELGLDALSWTEIPHTFQSPMYYMSYATGMLAALQLLANTDTAADAYRTVLHRSAHAAFRETLTGAGLCDPFDPAAQERIERAWIRETKKG